MRRRDWLKATAAAFPYGLLAADQKRHANDRVKLGPRNIELSRMAIGTGTNGWNGSSNQTRQMGIQGLADHLHAGFDEGINFWDSADMYGSHPHLKEALKRIPREKVVIMTKTVAKTADQMKKDLDRYRKEAGTDYFDIVLLHAVTDADWPTNLKGVMDVLSEARERGVVRTLGISCHSIGALRAAAKSPWVEVDLARINPGEEFMDADVPTVLSVLREMKSRGKGVIGMKIMGAGRLVSQKEQCLQFALSKAPIDCFTIGMESRAHLTDMLKSIPAASVRG